MRQFATVMTALAIAATPAKVASREPSSPSAQRHDLESFVKIEMRLNQIPGLAYAVVRDGNVVAEGLNGVGSVEWGAPITRHSRFQLASVTKLFTGLLLMRMVEDGTIDLDRPIGFYLKDSPPSWAPIKLRHIANHTSGIAEQPEGATLGSLDAVYKAVAAKPLDWAPGSKARYGFNDFAVLRLALERRSGRSYQQLLDDYVLKPLKLSDTGFSEMTDDGTKRVARVIPGRVTVYDRAPDGLRTYDYLYPRHAYAAGGLYSSIADLEKVLIAVEGGTFLSRGSVDQLISPALLTDGSKGEFGVGWIAHTHHGAAVAGHSGGPALADLLYFPAQRTAVVVVQNQHALYPWLAGAIADRFVVPRRPTAVRDAQPAVSARVLGALRGAATGTVDPAGWSPTARAEFLPWFAGDGGVLVRSLGHARGAVLVADRADPADAAKRERTYSVDFERATLRWVASVNPDGTLEALVPSDS